jgi:hypothetical protein
MGPRPRAALLLAGGVLAAACAPGPAAPPTSPAPEMPAASSACALTSDSAGPGRAVTAAFDDPADAGRARRAVSVLAPVRLDCEGRPLPGLAAAWSRDTSGRFWTLELGTARSEDAGAAWTAGALAATWRADPQAAAALRWAGVESLLPLDQRRLTVGFSAPEPELPTVFADRSLGVARPAPPGSPVVPQAAGADLRDAVDGGIDLVHTRDPGLIEYASRRPGLATIPLPWDRSYLLLLPPRSQGVGAAIPPDTSGFRSSLARDAVRADARPAAPSLWGARSEGCRPTPVPLGRRPATDAVVYRAADRVARDLAERVVALAAVPAIAARGLDDESFRSALVSGADRAYVVAVPIHAAVPCRERAGWPPGATVLPLVETRPHVILRRGTPPLAVEWDGAVVSP